MSANALSYTDAGRSRTLRHDVWWETDGTLPPWLSTTNGSTPGALPANWTMDGVGMQTGQGHQRLICGASASVASEARIASANTVSFTHRVIELQVGGMVFSENSAASGDDAAVTEMDYFLMVAGSNYGVFLEHTAANGHTTLRVLENGVTRRVRPHFVELVKANNGGCAKSMGLRTRQIRRDQWVAEVLINGRVAYQEPLSWGLAAASVNNVRPAFGMRKVSGSTERWLRFESVQLRVQR